MLGGLVLEFFNDVGQLSCHLLGSKFSGFSWLGYKFSGFSWLGQRFFGASRFAGIRD
jgi:hypothetical protein